MNKHRQSWTETDIVDGNFDGNDIAGLVRSPGIVILTESHDIHTLRTQSGTHRRRRSGLAGLKCQLYHSDHCKMQRPINGRKGLKNCAENAVRIELNWMWNYLSWLCRRVWLLGEPLRWRWVASGFGIGGTFWGWKRSCLCLWASPTAKTRVADIW